jgi:hypothetical protein
MGHYRNDKGEEAGPISNTGSPAHERFTNQLKCPHCGQTGEIIWEEAAIGRREAGPQRRLVGISPTFHAENGRTQSGDPLIVCTSCDSIQAD